MKQNVLNLYLVNVLKKMIRILSKDPKERSVQDKKLLFELTKDIEFFLQYQENQYVIESCCQYMTYEYFEDTKSVFEIGKLQIKLNIFKIYSINQIQIQNFEIQFVNSFYTVQYLSFIKSIGDKFFIILEGSVGVYIYNESKEMMCVKKLMKGSSFGELALLYESPRMATITCLENCHFAVLQKKEFLRVLKNEQKEKLNRKLLYLQSLPLFQKINAQLLRQIYSKAFDINTVKDQVIFKQGDPTQNFYIVKSGEFSVKHAICEEKEGESIQQSLSQFDNQELQTVTNIGKQKSLAVQVALLIASDYFGEEDLLRQRPKRSYTIQCTTAVGEIIMIQRSLFIAILDEYHSSVFLKEHLKIKEQQYEERLNNAKKQMRKFKGFLVEDRFQLKVKKQIEEQQQNNFQRNNFDPSPIKEILLNQKKVIQFKVDDQTQQSQQPRFIHTKKKSATTAVVIDQEKRKELDEKIQTLIQLKGNDGNKKPRIPKLQDSNKFSSKNSVPNLANLKQSKQISTKSAQNVSDLSYSFHSGSSEQNTPTHSPQLKQQNSTDKAYLLKVFQQKQPYTSRLNNDTSLFDKYQKNYQNISNDGTQLLNLDENENPSSNILDENLTLYKQKSNSQKLIQKKPSYNCISERNLDRTEYNKSLSNLSLSKKQSNQNQMIIGRISELKRANQSPYQNQNSAQDFAQNLRQQKIVSYFNQTSTPNLNQNISSQNEPGRQTNRQKMIEMFDDSNQIKFISNFFKKSQVKKLTEQKKDLFQQVEEREAIKCKLMSKGRKDNFIDCNSNDQRQQLLDSVNTLISPRQISQFNDGRSTPQSTTTFTLPKYSSQPTLRYIDMQKSDRSESGSRQIGSGVLTEKQKKKKFNLDLNSITFLNSQQQLSGTNLQPKSQTNASAQFKMDFGTSRSNLNNGSSSTRNAFSNTQIAPFQNASNTQTNNIHVKKEQSNPTKQKPLKMNIRFQNLFKNH